MTHAESEAVSPDTLDVEDGFEPQSEIDSKTTDNKIQIQHLAAYPSNESARSQTAGNAKDAFQTDAGKQQDPR